MSSAPKTDHAWARRMEGRADSGDLRDLCRNLERQNNAMAELLREIRNPFNRMTRGEVCERINAVLKAD